MAVPSVGQRAPEFAVVDQDRNPVTLESLRRRGTVVLVFYRGHWCPYCRRQLTRLQESVRAIAAHGASLVALSVDPPRLSRRLAEELGIGFPLLCNPDGSAIDAYGVRNRLLGARSGIPHPAVFVIDARGVIRFREVHRNYRRRTSARRILRILEKLKETAEKA